MKREKLVLFLGFVFLSSIGLARPLPPTFVGDYKATEDIQWLGARQTKIIRASNERDREFLKDLKSRGFTCLALPQNYLYSCTKAIPPQPKEETKKILSIQWSQYSLSFKVAQGDYSLINNSQGLVEWEREQQVIAPEQSFEKVYFVQTPLVNKLKLSGSKSTLWVNLKANNENLLAIAVGVSERQELTSPLVLSDDITYLAEITLRRTHESTRYFYKLFVFKPFRTS